MLSKSNLAASTHEVKEFLRTTQRHLTEKLALIPTTKLVVTDFAPWLNVDTEVLPQETLNVRLNDRGKLATIFEVLNKRWPTLDLISAFREVQRTAQLHIPGNFRVCDIFENLSCLPRLQKTDP